jgi:hypothetical protein
MLCLPTAPAGCPGGSWELTCRSELGGKLAVIYALSQSILGKFSLHQALTPDLQYFFLPLECSLREAIPSHMIPNFKKPCYVIKSFLA